MNDTWNQSKNLNKCFVSSYFNDEHLTTENCFWFSWYNYSLGM